MVLGPLTGDVYVERIPFPAKAKARKTAERKVFHIIGQALIRLLRKTGFVSINLFRWPIWTTLGFLRLLGIKFFDYLFLISPGTSKNLGDIDQYCPLWISKTKAFSEAVNLFVGLIRKSNGCGRGLIVGTFKTSEDFLKNKELGTKFNRQLRRICYLIGAKSVALSGQMPGQIAHHGVEIKEPLVKGNKGATFCISETIGEVMKRGLKTGQFQIAIVGVGYTGQLVMDYLRSLGHKVVGIDIKPRNHSVVLAEEAPKVLGQSEMVVVLTPDGRDFVPYIRYLKPGTIVIDDTHPRIRAKVDGTIFYKVAVTMPGVGFLPRLPGYNKNWIPGCVVEAMIAAKTGSFNGSDQEKFNIEARKIGLKALLVK